MLSMSENQKRQRRNKPSFLPRRLKRNRYLSMGWMLQPSGTLRGALAVFVRIPEQERGGLGVSDI